MDNNQIGQEIKEDIEPSYMKLCMGIFELNNSLAPNSKEYIKALGELVNSAISDIYVKSIKRRLL